MFLRVQGDAFVFAATMISAVWLCGCVWMFISKRLVLDIACLMRELGKIK